MATIPASQIVQVNPAVLAAAGAGIDINGVLLTTSSRVPIGVQQSFATALDVGTYFGVGSQEKTLADKYFLGFDNSNIKPGRIFYAQYNPTQVAAWLRGSTMAGTTLQEIQVMSGSLGLTVDGFARSAASISLGPSISFSNAAAIIQGDLNASLPTGAVCTGSIGAQVCNFTGYINGNILTVTAISAGNLVVGGTLLGAGVAANTQITGQVSGAVSGSLGDYAVSISQTVASGTMTESYGLMNITVLSSGYLQAGEAVTGTGGGGVHAATQITALASGTGGTGTYVVNVSQTITSTTLTMKAVPLTVTWDSTSEAFVITSGVVGSASTITFGSGTLATDLNLTLIRGGLTSQGADPATPAVFMDNVAATIGDWATFMTCFDPDAGGGNTQKLLFAQWVAESNNRYCYVCWDPDESPAAANPATNSLGYMLLDTNSSGTYLIGNGVGAGETGGPFAVTADYAAFICGAAASIDFTERNGRTTFAFRSQSGLEATCTDATSAQNLIANGYNFYGAYATANQQFVWNYPGQITGEFKWMDSYIDQIWMNANFQVALMVLLRDAKSIPYNAAGYALIQAACLDVINMALNFGAIRTGITLSQSQAAQVNNSAGVQIDNTLNFQGWYMQVLDAAPSVRQVRGSPPCTFWYTDGQSIQRIVLASIELM